MGGVDSTQISVGLRYIAICECYHPAISELVLFLRILDAVQRDQWSRPVEGLARICKHSRYFPHQPSAELTPRLCILLADG